jgi:hypothetical protein
LHPCLRRIIAFQTLQRKRKIKQLREIRAERDWHYGAF